MIEEVLRRKYPQPQNQDRPAVFGFVDIHEGVRLFGRNGNQLEILHAVRCRGRYCPATMGGSVDVVVPGFGICATKIAGGVNFVPDTECPIIPSSQFERLTSLTLNFTICILESEAALVQLLNLIGRGLRTLALESSTIHIDLCMLATAWRNLR